MPNADLAPADLLESANHNAELTARAEAAVRRAAALASGVGLYADEVEHASRGAREAAREMLQQDLRDTQAALREAARLLGLADPLGCVDTSDLYLVLSEAKACFHASLTSLGVDALSLAA